MIHSPNYIVLDQKIYNYESDHNFRSCFVYLDYVFLRKDNGLFFVKKNCKDGINYDYYDDVTWDFYKEYFELKD